MSDQQTREVPAKKRPSIETSGDAWCWMNTWGDLDRHGYDPLSPEAAGYKQAIMDLLSVLDRAGITATDYEWRKWTGYP